MVLRRAGQQVLLALIVAGVIALALTDKLSGQEALAFFVGLVIPAQRLASEPSLPPLDDV